MATDTYLDFMSNFSSYDSNSSNMTSDLSPDLDMCKMMKSMNKLQPDNKSYEEYNMKLFTYYLMGLSGTCISSLGILGNIMSLIVIARLGMRSTSTYIYLGMLAVCDTLVCILSVILLSNDTVRPQLDTENVNRNSPFPYLFPYVHPAALTFQVTSIWLTLAFTVDRYIMICHPFKAEKFCTPTRAWLVTSALLLTGIIFNIPRFFEYKTLTYYDMCGERMVRLQMTEFGSNVIFRQLFHSWFYLLFVCGLPFVALAVMNTFLIYTVHESRKRGREINAAERKRNDTTIMLIGVTVIFFTCQVPALVSRMLWAFRPNFEKNSTLFYLNEIGSFLVALNSAINIVPYYFFGKRFRSEFWQVFCPCILRKLGRSSSMSQVSNQTLKQTLGNESYGNGYGNGKTQPFYENGNGYQDTKRNGSYNDGQVPLIHVTGNAEKKGDVML